MDNIFQKFWQSDNLFVIFTDAWHLFGFIMRVTFGISFIIVGYLAGAVSLYYLFGALINYIVFIGVFHIFHTYKILKNEHEQNQKNILDVVFGCHNWCDNKHNYL